MIFFQSHQTRSRTFLTINTGLAKLWAGSRSSSTIFFAWKKRIEFVAFQLCIAGVDSSKTIFVWQTNIPLFLKSNILQMVINGLWSTISSWPIERMLTCWSTWMISTILTVSTTIDLTVRAASSSFTTPDRTNAVLCNLCEFLVWCTPSSTRYNFRLMTITTSNRR